jgi:hypothetical protein
MYEHVPFEVKLRDGRTIRMENLDQFRHEAGRLEGYPTQETNARTVELARQRVGERSGPPVLVVPRVEELIVDDDGRASRAGIHAEIPSVCCSAYFRSLSPLVGDNSDREGFFVSGLTMLWFQEQWAMPIDASVVEAIQAIHWAAIAREWEL